MMVAKSQLAEAEGRSSRPAARCSRPTTSTKPAPSCCGAIPTPSPSATSKAQVLVDTAQGAVDAAVACKASVQSQIDFPLPAEKASAEATLPQAQIDARQEPGRRRHRRHRPAIRAAPRRCRQPDAAPRRHPRARPPRHRPDRRLRPDRGAGDEGRHGRRGHLRGDPLHRHPGRGHRGAGRDRLGPDPPDRPAAWTPRPSPSPAPSPPTWSRCSRAASTGCRKAAACIANAYTSNHDALQDPNIGAVHAFVLHAIDATGLVHAMLLRLQALILPFRTLVLGGATDPPAAAAGGAAAGRLCAGGRLARCGQHVRDPADGKATRATGTAEIADDRAAPAGSGRSSGPIAACSSRALAALTVTAGLSLSLPLAVRRVIDNFFSRVAHARRQLLRRRARHRARCSRSARPRASTS